MMGNKKMTKWGLSKLWVLLAVIGLALLGCAKKSNAEQLKVGILQYVEHDSLDEVRKGFIEELEKNGYKDGEKIKIDYLNASADAANLSTMSSKITKSNDYILAIGTQVAQSLVGVQSGKSIYFSAVSDPVAAGIVESLEKPGAQVTGTTDAGPLSEQIELIKKVYPTAQKIGLIYNSGEANAVSEMEKAKNILQDKNYQVIEKTVTSTNDIHSVMTSLLKESDVVFIVADNTIASSMPLVGSLAVEAGKGLFGGSADMVLENGLATYGLNYRELGQQTARMLIRQIEEGVEPKDMPVETAESLNVIVNKKNAEALGLKVEDFNLDKDGGE